jgi:hypothetical protein
LPGNQIKGKGIERKREVEAGLTNILGPVKEVGER